MSKLLMTAIAALVLSAPAQAASPCKALAETACGALAGCKWQDARVAGEVSPASGNTYKRSAKAHCRKGGKASSTASKPANI